MQKTGWSNYSSLLVWSCLQKGFTYGCDHMGFFVIFFKVWEMFAVVYESYILWHIIAVLLANHERWQ